MSQHLGEVGVGLNVGAFCGHEGRRESYQIEGPKGTVQFTWEEWNQIKEKVENHHVLKHTPEGRAI